MLGKTKLEPRNFATVLKAVSLRVLLDDYPHYTYILEKFNKRKTAFDIFASLDDHNRAKVRQYFRKWNIEFDEPIKEMQDDWFNMPLPDFLKKYEG